MGPYDEEKEGFLDHNDVNHDVLNGNLYESSLTPGHYLDGDGVEYDSEYNRLT